MYLYGRGVEESLFEGMRWIKRAADNGDSEALYNMGYFYESGIGVEQDHEHALEWYRKAAQKGDADAAKAVRRLEQAP